MAFPEPIYAFFYNIIWKLVNECVLYELKFVSTPKYSPIFTAPIFT